MNDTERLTLDLSVDEARWLRDVIGRIALRFDDVHAPVLQRRIDLLLHPEDRLDD